MYIFKFNFKKKRKKEKILNSRDVIHKVGRILTTDLGIRQLTRKQQLKWAARLTATLHQISFGLKMVFH